MLDLKDTDDVIITSAKTGVGVDNILPVRKEGRKAGRRRHHLTTTTTTTTKYS